MMNHHSSQKHRGVAAIAYLFFFVPLFMKEKHDHFVAYHLKQGIGLFITAAALRGIMTALAGPPYTSLGAQLSRFLLQPIHIFLIVLLILGIKNALSGETKPLPIIGEYANKL